MDEDKLTAKIVAALKEAIKPAQEQATQTGTIDTEALGTAIVKGVGGLLEAQRMEDKAAAEKAAADKASETEKAALEESVRQRTADMLDIRDIVPADKFAEYQKLPLEEAMRKALEGTYPEVKSMSLDGMRGLLHGVVSTRRKGLKESAPSGGGGGGNSSLGVRWPTDGIGFRQYERTTRPPTGG